MADPFLAEVRLFGFNFAPVGWALCNGQILPISQNTALFSLLGTNYGGNGTTNFALPNVQDSFAMGAGQGPGLTLRNLGDVGGEASVTLGIAQMPAHSHTLNGGSSPSSTSPAGATMAPTSTPAYKMPGTLAPMAASSLGGAGSGNPHENRQPFLGVNFCIALQGIFPARS